MVSFDSGIKDGLKLRSSLLSMWESYAWWTENGVKLEVDLEEKLFLAAEKRFVELTKSFSNEFIELWWMS